MNPISKVQRWTIASAAVGAALIASGATANNEPLGDMYVWKNQVAWEPNADNDDALLVLTVATPDDQVISEAFAPGDTPVFTPNVDGTYSYEMYAVPRQPVMSASGSAGAKGARNGTDANGRPLAATSQAVAVVNHRLVNGVWVTAPQAASSQADAGSASSTAAQTGVTQSGSFSVVGGMPVDPNLVEE